MNAGKEQRAMIFDIQGFSVHDGPGCRTLIFFKGCPLNCFWCSNPEGIDPRPVLLFYSSHCRCQQLRCIQSCSKGAITPDRKNKLKPHFDRRVCINCNTFDCVQGCYFDALRICGREYGFDELIDLIERDSYFWGENGGVTLGGGEPLVQANFVVRLLDYCQQNHIHTTIETSAAVEKEIFLKVIQLADWIFIDLKHLDPQKHLQATGHSNKRILENISALKAFVLTKRIIVRIPIIPGFNDDWQNLKETINFLKSSGLSEVNLLPLHHFGESKYNQLAKNYRAGKINPPNVKRLAEIQSFFVNFGLNCYSGSSTPF